MHACKIIFMSQQTGIGPNPKLLAQLSDQDCWNTTQRIEVCSNTKLCLLSAAAAETRSLQMAMMRNMWDLLRRCLADSRICEASLNARVVEASLLRPKLWAQNLILCDSLYSRFRLTSNHMNCQWPHLLQFISSSNTQSHGILRCLRRPPATWHLQSANVAKTPLYLRSLTSRR